MRTKAEYISIGIMLLTCACVCAYWLMTPVVEGPRREERSYTTSKALFDDYGYGECPDGPSIYVQSSYRLADSTGTVPLDKTTQWEVTVIADHMQDTEYLIFKDTETGNICAVERRKWAEEKPEE